ncbi:hypothetical protein AYI69_g7779 [Smittium culicis]|uniref:Uncharacterized protein n=1 Tax=Smittium culicis TaxID=133412 RepID=A0A1R1XPP0_9FUNG|nr:hypothetical protein AYI69_g7779 [Smittium culicis]
MSSETLISEAVIANILNAINDLTSKVDNLTPGKTAEPSVEDDQHISASIPATVLNVYPELESLIPSISEDFYRTMLTDGEEKGGNLWMLKKSSKVCYNPPPINEAAPGSVKKADSVFYAIQIALAHRTRCIMGNAASMETQARLDNLLRGISFTGNPEQVVGSEVKPLIVSEKFDTQLAAIKPTKSARLHYCNGADHRSCRNKTGSEFLRWGVSEGSHGQRSREPKSLEKSHGQSVGPENRGEGIPRTFQDIGIKQQGLRGKQTKYFCVAGPLGWPKATQAWPASTKKREMVGEEFAASPKSDIDGASPTDNASYAIQAEAQPRGPPEPNGRGGGSTNEEGHRGEDRRNTPSIGSKEAEPAPRGNKLLDGISSMNLQDNLEKGLYDVLGFEGRIPAYSNTQVVQ